MHATGSATAGVTPVTRPRRRRVVVLPYYDTGMDRASDPAGPGRRRRRAWSSSSPLGSESDFNLSYSLRHSWHCQRYSAGESATLSRRRGQPEGHHTLRRVAFLELKHASVRASGLAFVSFADSDIQVALSPWQASRRSEPCSTLNHDSGKQNLLLHYSKIVSVSTEVGVTSVGLGHG